MPSGTLRIPQVIKHALNGWKIVWISMVCWKIHHFNQFRSMIFREIIRNLHVVRGFPIAAMITRGCHGEPRPTDRCLNMTKQKLHIDLYIFNHIYTICTCAYMKKNNTCRWPHMWCMCLCFCALMPSSDCHLYTTENSVLRSARVRNVSSSASKI